VSLKLHFIFSRSVKIGTSLMKKQIVFQFVLLQFILAPCGRVWIVLWVILSENDFDFHLGFLCMLLNAVLNTSIWELIYETQLVFCDTVLDTYNIIVCLTFWTILKMAFILYFTPEEIALRLLPLFLSIRIYLYTDVHRYLNLLCPFLFKNLNFCKTHVRLCETWVC